MWKIYSKNYIKNNRAAGISVITAAFISALLLSLLCSLFYNFWAYDIAEIQRDEGLWQARLTGDIGADALAAVQSYANVERAEVNEELSDENGTVVDLYFINMRSVLTDAPKAAALAGLDAEAVSFHHSLLSMYMIRDPADPAPRLVFPLQLLALALACFSLIFIIHNAFAVSMNARTHQFGIFSSIGATPGQIRVCLLQEAAALCAIPVILGNMCGLLLGIPLLGAANRIAADVPGHIDMGWSCHPLIPVLSLLITAFTVLLSAWIPARRLSRLTPLQAIRGSEERAPKRKKRSRILSFLFGIEGELAGNTLKAQKLAMRTSSLSLVLSFLAFTLMLCFFTLSDISTQMTYFERYQDAWDVMVTLNHVSAVDFENIEEIQDLSGVKSAVLYQRAQAKRTLSDGELSEAFRKNGGFDGAPGTYVNAADGAWTVNVPIVVMDDESFLAYCGQIGAEPRTDGAVILNRIRDVHNPNFRDPQYMPYIEEESKTTLQGIESGQEAVLPVIAYTEETPVLREEYATLDYYELVHFLPLSVWSTVKEQIGGAKEDSYIRVLANGEPELDALNALETEIMSHIAPGHSAESENRIQEKLTNDEMIRGMQLIYGGFCALLAVIGLGNIFSHTLGFVRQRKREIARLQSVGMTPESIRRMFCIEALVIAGRPALVTAPITAAFVALMLKASYLEPSVFLRQAPILPVAAFLLAIFAFVALAYRLGGGMVLKADLAETLRDDTML